MLKHGGVKTASGKILSPKFDTVGVKIVGAVDLVVARLGYEEIEQGVCDIQYLCGSYDFVAVKPTDQAFRTFYFALTSEAERFFDYMSELNDYAMSHKTDELTKTPPRLTIKERLAAAKGLNEDLSARLTRLRRYIRENISNASTRRALGYLLQGYDARGNSVEGVDVYGRPKKSKNHPPT